MSENARYPPHMTKGFEFQLIGKVCAWTLDELVTYTLIYQVKIT